MLIAPSETGIRGIGGRISTVEASVGPGNPPHVPSGLWMGTGGWSTISGISAEGEKGVGVGVANGLGVANGPRGEPAREQLANGMVRTVNTKNQANTLFFGLVKLHRIILSLNLSN
jgi:hypothetical protein